MTDSPLLSLALRAIEEHERATEGPWIWKDRGSTRRPRGVIFKESVEKRGRISVAHLWDDGQHDTRADAELICSMRSREPLLARAVIEGAERERKLEALLRDLQWSGGHDGDECPECYATRIAKVPEHREGCRIAAALSAPPPPGANRPTTQET